MDSRNYTALSSRDAEQILKRRERVAEAIEAFQADAALQGQRYQGDGEMFGDPLSGTGIYAFTNHSSDRSVRQNSSLSSLSRACTRVVDGRQSLSERQVSFDHNWVSGRSSIHSVRSQHYPANAYLGSEYNTPIGFNPFEPYTGTAVMSQQMAPWSQQANYRVLPANWHQMQMTNPLSPPRLISQPLGRGDPFQTNKRPQTITVIIDAPGSNNTSISSLDGSPDLDDLLVQSILNHSSNGSINSLKGLGITKDLAVPSGNIDQVAKSTDRDEEKVADKNILAPDHYELSSSRQTLTNDEDPFGLVENGSTMEDNDVLRLKSSGGGQGTDSLDVEKRRV